jgi:hypothetical protein
VTGLPAGRPVKERDSGPFAWAMAPSVVRRSLGGSGRRRLPGGLLRKKKDMTVALIWVTSFFPIKQ